ncbi:NAD-dependent epimerase/dehydratase family protein [Salinibacter ruber]|uniref:Nucleoside-diphosphate-sugar epimerase n=1 Tax=Salinibacter ruber TaxID=146919 RepID=A0A9X2V8E4_9BACT|nr:NAD-dependent epimerase/dehydratase family protein [Salinibacter ruber]MCS4122750.1 nucleoside-diphosphate-sugar epimerase [Salinibacter ruber]
MNRVLLLGGAGFIGYHLGHHLVERGNCQVTLVDNFFRSRRDEELDALLQSPAVDVVEGDLTKRSTFDQLGEAYDHVYALAAVVGVGYTEDMPEEVWRVNTAITLNTFEWLRESDVSRVLFASTSETYAGTVEELGAKVPTPEEVPLTITDITQPRFTYAVTKMLGEAGIAHYAEAYDFEQITVRFHNVYGPRMGFKHVIPQVVERFYEEENPFTVYGYGQTRAFCHIDDAVHGLEKAMHTPEAAGQTYHIGDDRDEITIETLIRYIGDLMEFDGEYEKGPSHAGSVSRRCPDVDRARNVFGYEPQVHWKEGVQDTVEWYADYYRAGREVFE